MGKIATVTLLLTVFVLTACANSEIEECKKTMNSIYCENAHRPPMIGEPRTRVREK